MTNKQIKYMVNRFLGWRLPSPWYPDGGISFKEFGNEGTPHQYRNEPTGTNLFDATQAEVMVRHMLDGMPAALDARVNEERAREIAGKAFFHGSAAYAALYRDIRVALDAKDIECEARVRKAVERCAKVAYAHRSGRKPMELLRARADVIIGRDAASEEIAKAIRSLSPTPEPGDASSGGA